MERNVTKSITRKLISKGALIFACVASEKQSGWPDRYVSHRRWHGWIEFKGVDTVLQDNQKYIIEQLLLRNENVVIIRETLSTTVARLEDTNGNKIRNFYIDDILELLVWSIKSTV